MREFARVTTAFSNPTSATTLALVLAWALVLELVASRAGGVERADDELKGMAHGEVHVGVDAGAEAVAGRLALLLAADAD